MQLPLKFNIHCNLYRAVCPEIISRYNVILILTPWIKDGNLVILCYDFGNYKQVEHDLPGECSPE